ncbi:hypothetical protein GIB67_017754 [Kingdonia uniflora]|uniref:Uncharacterized protein n=1 Tax=Kingdonia uniflora TaxID=39325 RepID=A0A7J7LPZ9_9MAGN|nr:hypothetical protein GIB67_017754 [Kingdonia uniflora]
MGGNSDVEELDIVKDAPLAMLGMHLPLRRLVKEVLNFWEVASCQMNENFYEMMKVIEGMNVNLHGEGRSSIE